MGASYKVVCIGDATIDIFLPLDPSDNFSIKNHELSFPLGEKFLADGYQMFLGGIATNVSVGLSRLETKTALMAEIGDDEFSQKILNDLTRENISTEMIIKTAGKKSTLSAIVIVKGEHILFAAHVPRKHNFQLQDLNSEWIYITGLGIKWEDVYKNVLQEALNKNIKIAFAPGVNQLQQNIDLCKEILSKSEIVFLNKAEAKKITGKDSEINELLTEVKNLGAKTVVITDAMEGSYSMDANSNIYFIDALRVDVVETTGAGDAYASGFFAAYLSGESMEKAMKWATLNSSSVVQKVGAQEGLLSIASLQEKLPMVNLTAQKL